MAAFNNIFYLMGVIISNIIVLNSLHYMTSRFFNIIFSTVVCSTNAPVEKVKLLFKGYFILYVKIR